MCCSLEHVFTMSFDLGGWFMFSTHLWIRAVHFTPFTTAALFIVLTWAFNLWVRFLIVWHGPLGDLLSSGLMLRSTLIQFSSALSQKDIRRISQHSLGEFPTPVLWRKLQISLKSVASAIGLRRHLIVLLFTLRYSRHFLELVTTRSITGRTGLLSRVSLMLWFRLPSPSIYILYTHPLNQRLSAEPVGVASPQIHKYPQEHKHSGGWQCRHIYE